MNHCLITAASNRFFPSLLNLIGSIKANYPDHPKIYVYSIGLLTVFKNELKQIDNLEVIETPHFCLFWRKCYTWKAYIFNQPLGELNLFLDAGNQVLQPLDEMFDQIEKNGYLAVSQGGQLEQTVPPEYKKILSLKSGFEKEPYITSGIFGFKSSNEIISQVRDEVYQAALSGMCLGYSPSEQHRNKGKDKTFFIRDCQTFRHEQTLLNILLRKYLGDFKINPINKYAGWQSPHEDPKQLIWNLRRNYIKLEYAGRVFKKNARLKRSVLNLFFLTLSLKRKIRNLLKNQP